MNDKERIDQESVKGYIDATTAYGGDDFCMFSEYYTDENRSMFERWLSSQPRVSGIELFRGYCFDPAYWEDGFVEVGAVIGVDQMTQAVDLPGFTKGPLRASRYMNEFGEGVFMAHRQKVLFCIQTDGKYFVDVSTFSHYKSEDEHRCVRDAVLEVVAMRQRGGYLEVKCKEV